MIFIWATILVLGVLIFVHELGHYLAARSVGVRVERFSIAFPPRFLSFRIIFFIMSLICIYNIKYKSEEYEADFLIVK